MASHVGAVELDEFAGGDDAVEDRFSDDCVVQGLVPVLGVELGGDQCGSSAFSGGEDVEQFAGGLTGRPVCGVRRHRPTMRPSLTSMSEVPG